MEKVKQDEDRASYKLQGKVGLYALLDDSHCSVAIGTSKDQLSTPSLEPVCDPN